MTNASEDAWLNRLENDLGLAGYARWWKLLEIIASEMDGTDKCEASFRPGFWCRALRFRSLNDCRSFLERLANDRRIVPEWLANEWSIKCPKLLEIRERRRNNQRTQGALDIRVKNEDEEEEKDVPATISKPRVIKTETLNPEEPITKLFFAYCESWGRNPNTYRLTPQRRDWIRKAVEIYGVETTMDGVKNFRRDDYDKRAKFNDIKYLFGTQDRIDKWCGMSSVEKKPFRQLGLEEIKRMRGMA